MQVNYQISKNKGFNEKKVLVYPFYASSVNRNRIEQMQKLAEELQINSSIKDVSISGSAPFVDFYSYNNFYSESAGASSIVQMKYNIIDLNYISTLEINLTEGRIFIPEDMHNSVCLINETAKRKLGLENAIGSIIQPMNLEVIGVLKDYHTGDMNWPIFPLIMTPRIDTVSYTKNVLIIRLAEENTEKVRTWINSKTKEFFPDDRIEYGWLESYIPYGITKTISKIFEIFSVIAICISIIGLFGMVTYSTVARSKEIGIRKVMGASSRTIFSLLLKSHLKLVVIANVISWPLAYYIMKMFLQIFAYRINISIFVFVATGLITFLIMFLTVGYHILKASRTNPIKELSYE
jgi:putative ABC transport system permease protein